MGGNQIQPLSIRIRETVEDIPTSIKFELRKELGIDPDAFVFCSFGLMAPSKLNNEVIQAFHQLMEVTHENAVLIFVGPLAGGEYGEQTQKFIEEFQLNDRLMITGYKYKNEYDKYLACADAAIQLRQGSRGETSRAVLDSMAYGLPTVINAHGSLNDYCDDDVVKLKEVPDIDEIAAAMIRILTDKEFRILKGQRAKDTIFEKHHPEKIALDYARVIERAICDDERKLFAPFIDTFSQIRPFTDLQPAARCAALNTELRCQPRILVDITGIQGEPEIERLVRNIFATNDRSIHFDIVEIIENKLVRANWAVKRFFNLPEQTNISIEEKKDILPGDILFLTPTFKVNSGQLLKIINDVKVKGGKIISMYDASLLDEIPDILYESDVIICNSLKEANRVSGHSRKIHQKNALVDIYYFTYDQIPHKFKNGSAIDKEVLATWLLGEIHETKVIKEFEKI